MARADPPGMVISDILMPVMDGYQLCMEWKKDSKLKDIPFIFNTASYIDEKDKRFALKLGANKFIRKPIKPDEFIRIIQDVIGDVKAGRTKPKEPFVKEDKEILKLYSERLVKKLEVTNLDLEKEIIERKQAEEKIKEYSENLESMVEERTRELNRALYDTEEARDRIDGILKSIADGLIVTDMHNRVVLMNRAAEVLLLFIFHLECEFCGCDIDNC